MLLSVQILHGRIHVIVHRGGQIPNEKASNTSDCTERRRNHINHPNPIRQGVLQRNNARPDDGWGDTRDLRQGRGVFGGEGADESLNRGRGQAGLERRGSDVAGDFSVEAVVHGGGVNGGEDGRGHGSGARCDGGRCGDEMVRRGELDASDDEDKGGTESDSGQAAEDDRLSGVGRLNGGQTDDTGHEEKESDEQRRSDCLEFRARVAVTYGAESGADPEWLLPCCLEERVGFKERRSPIGGTCQPSTIGVQSERRSQHTYKTG